MALAAASATSAAGQPRVVGQAESPRPSLARGDILRTRILGTANCSPDPNAICEDVLIEAQIEIVEQLAGPRVPRRTVVRYIAHMPLGPGTRAWLLVLQERHHYRPAVLLRTTNGRGRRELCVDVGGLMHFGVAPEGGIGSGESRCYRR